MPNETELQGGTALETPTGPGTGAVEVDVASGSPPDVRPPTLPTVSAESVIGLDEGETPKSVLDRAAQRMRDQQPNNPLNLVRDPETGRFVRPKPKAAAAPTKPAPVKPVPAAVKPPASAAAAAPKPAAPPAQEPKKIKVGDNEYTEAELAKLLEKGNTPQPAPQPAPQPQAAPQPQGPSAGQIKAAEDKFVAEMAKTFQGGIGTEAELEAILTGGKEGLEAFNNVIRNVAARAILETRKSIYPDFEGHLHNLYSALEPLHAQQFELERYATEQAFVSQFPEYTGEDLQLARTVAEELLARFPEQINRMSREQFIAEVDKQTDRLKQGEWSRYRREGDPESWKDYVRAKKAAAAVPPATTAQQPMAGPQSQPAPAPAPAPAPKPKPPGANSPGVPGTGQTARSKHSAIAASLQD